MRPSQYWGGIMSFRCECWQNSLRVLDPMGRKKEVRCLVMRKRPSLFQPHQ